MYTEMSVYVARTLLKKNKKHTKYIIKNRKLGLGGSGANESEIRLERNQSPDRSGRIQGESTSRHTSQQARKVKVIEWRASGVYRRPARRLLTSQLERGGARPLTLPNRQTLLICRDVCH